MATTGPDHHANALAPGTVGRDGRAASTKPLGWALAPTPIVERPDAHRPVALADLRDEEKLGGLLRIVGAFEASTARAGGAILGHAIGAYVAVCLAPLAFDSVSAEVDADQLGFDLGEDGRLRSVWMSRGAARFAPGRPAREHGEGAARLLLPIATALRVTARIGDRGSDLAIVDRLNGAARQLERSKHCTAEPGWVEEFVDGLGIGNPRSIRTIAVRPDDGPSIELPVPRVCCIGARRPTPDVCPTCPAVSDDSERTHRARNWLASIDEDAFASFVGRPRM